MGIDNLFSYTSNVGPQSQFESADAYRQLQQWGAEAAARKNLNLRNEQTAFDNNQARLSGLLSSGGVGSSNPFGGAPTMDMTNAFGAAPTLNTSNRFEAGLSDAEGRLRSLLDDPDSIRQSAAYKFRVKQGEESINRQLGAKGMLNSGNRLMELTKYGQDMGSQEYDAQAGRLNSLLGTYGQGWLGDKNANTNRFTAQSNAWLGGERANTDRFSAQSGAWNTAQGNADQNRYRMGSLAWEMNKPQSGGGTTRSSGGTNPIQQSPFSSGLGRTVDFSSAFSPAPGNNSPQPGTLDYNDWVSASNRR